MLRAVLKSRNMFCVQRDSCDLSQRWQAAAYEPTWNSRFWSECSPPQRLHPLPTAGARGVQPMILSGLTGIKRISPRELEAREFLREVHLPGYRQLAPC